MVDKEARADVRALDLGYLGGFVGLRVNELVMEAVERAGFSGFRESHGYVVQHFIDADRSISELAGRMEVTQQAASKVVAELIDLGILAARPAEEDRRSKRIRLSDEGWRLVKTTRRIRKRIHKRLVFTIGEDAYEVAKSALLHCLDQLGGIERIHSRRVPAPR